MKIVILEDLGVSQDALENKIQPLKEQGIEVVSFPRTSEVKKLQEEVQGADAIILANMPLPAEALEKADQLKFIDVAFTGVDHIPLALAREKGMTVSNASGYATEAVAELALAFMIDLEREVRAMDAATRAGKNKGSFRGRLLKDKTVGIVGAGEIGREVARLCKAFGARTLAYQRHPVNDAAIDEQCDLDTLLKEADIVSLHVPLTESTRHLIGEAELAKMKPTAFLINTARGPVVDSAALARALEAGQIAGAALDVFDSEPPLAENTPILQAPNTLFTPHIGYDTVESMEKRLEIVFANLDAWLEGHPKNQIL